MNPLKFKPMFVALSLAMATTASVTGAQGLPTITDNAKGTRISVAQNVKERFPLYVGSSWNYNYDDESNYCKDKTYGFCGGKLTRTITRLVEINGHDAFEIVSSVTKPLGILEKFPAITNLADGGTEYWVMSNQCLAMAQQGYYGLIESVKNATVVTMPTKPICVLRGLENKESVYMTKDVTVTAKLNGNVFDTGTSAGYFTQYDDEATYSSASLYTRIGGSGAYTAKGLKVNLSAANSSTMRLGLSLLNPGGLAGTETPVLTKNVGVTIGYASRLLFPVLLQSYNIPKSGLVASDNVTGLHWNAEESGWGINLNQQGKTIFATLFTYDASGAPMWLVASDLQQDTATGHYTGALYKTRNPVPFQPISQSNVTAVGNMNLDFWGNGFAVVTYTVNGVEVSKQIKYQKFGQNRATCSNTNALNRVGATNYQDLWWNPAESGWGVNLTHQDDTIFATLFTYKPSGDATWYVASGMTKQADGSFTGDLYKTTGTAFNVEPVVPLTGANVVKVGTASFKASNGENGVFTHSVDGVSVTKNVQRQVFGATQFVCAKG